MNDATTPRETCRYCRKPIATDAEYESIPEGDGGELCWSPWQGCNEDPEEAIDLRDAEIAELERELFEARKQLADWQVLQSATEQELASERALPANLLDVHAICDQRDKAVDDLHRERALADRLAGQMERWRELVGDLCTPSAADEALAAWKASRDQNNLEGAGPTEEERRENARAIQAMSEPERFRLMFHGPSKEQP